MPFPFWCFERGYCKASSVNEPVIKHRNPVWPYYLWKLAAAGLLLKDALSFLFGSPVHQRIYAIYTFSEFSSPHASSHHTHVWCKHSSCVHMSSLGGEFCSGDWTTRQHRPGSSQRLGIGISGSNFPCGCSLCLKAYISSSCHFQEKSKNYINIDVTYYHFTNETVSFQPVSSGNSEHT